jgi:hypothetical protein
MWTVDDLVSDAVAPVAPVIAVSGVMSTSFRIDITNYGDWQNVRYCTIDLSTHADFSDFVTAKYRAISAYPAVKMENIRMTGYWDTFNGLAPMTTHYLRIRAYNNIGNSETIINVTTL